MDSLIKTSVTLEEVLRDVDTGHVDVRRKLDVGTQSGASIEDASALTRGDPSVALLLGDLEHFLVRRRRTQVRKNSARDPTRQLRWTAAPWRSDGWRRRVQKSPIRFTVTAESQLNRRREREGHTGRARSRPRTVRTRGTARWVCPCCSSS